MAPVLEGKAPIPAIATTGAGKGKRPGKVTLLNPKGKTCCELKDLRARHGSQARNGFTHGMVIFLCQDSRWAEKSLDAYLISRFLVKSFFSRFIQSFWNEISIRRFFYLGLLDHFVSAQALLACCQPSLCLGACGDTEAVVPGGELFSLTQESPKLAFIQVIRS